MGKRERTLGRVVRVHVSESVLFSYRLIGESGIKRPSRREMRETLRKGSSIHGELLGEELAIVIRRGGLEGRRRDIITGLIRGTIVHLLFRSGVGGSRCGSGRLRFSLFKRGRMIII